MTNIIMKSIAFAGFLLVLLQLTAAQEVRKSPAQDRMEKCIRDLNLDAHKIGSLFRTSKYLPEDDEDVTKFIECVWKSGGYQEANGAINYDNIAKLVASFPKIRFGGNTAEIVGLETATNAATNCKNIPEGVTHGQTAIKLQNCMTKYIVDLLKLGNSN